MNDLASKNFAENRVLKKIGNITINDLMNDPKTDIVKRGNKISMRYQTEEGVASFEFAAYDTDRQTFYASSAPGKVYKKDYASDIHQMKNQGIRQKDIAFELGISESYVSKILKQDSK